jgi:hypothetical protein
MLDLTLATEFIPGTNLKGQVAGANWWFLLPSMERGRVLCIGTPAAAALITIARMSRSVVVVCEGSQRLHETKELCRARKLVNIEPIDTTAQLPLDDASVDLVVLSNAASQILPPGALATEFARVLSPTGLIYDEFANSFGSRATAKVRPVDGLNKQQQYWVTPLRGEMQTAVPVNDQRMIDYFLRRSLYSPSLKLPVFKRTTRFLNRRLAANQLTRRTSMITGRSDSGLSEQLPEYLRTIAGAAGVNVDNYRWGLVARGRYSSRKVLFFLFAPSSETPTYIIKMTRDVALNARLENEARALRRLYEKGLGDSEHLPQVVFSGHHNDLAIVGETIVAGAPFRNRIDGSASCRYLRDALDWLVELGARTADPTAATPAQVATGLETLFDRFVDIYRLEPAERDFLADQIAIVARNRTAIPLVFQHGDPGTWNLLATPEGRAAFLDWEAFEEQGMPLWDLFYFMRSYGVWSARKAGGDSLKAFSQQLLADTALGKLLVEVTERYCARSGLSPELVEPLFHTCWMHRALKEATRLPTERLEHGHYVSLLRLCIEQRNAPTLRRLFAMRAD